MARTRRGGPANHIRSSEANSGAAFLRKLALRLDPKNAPRMHSFAWNAFLGSRSAGYVPMSQSLTDMLSEPMMRSLVGIYQRTVDPVYGFIDHEELDLYIKDTWGAGTGRTPVRDAILCGVAAVGYLYSEVHPSLTELNLVETARQILEPLIFELPTFLSITAWTLRVIYLRIAGTHHVAWMASCTVMHMVEAAGLHFEQTDESVLTSESHKIDTDLRRRLVGVARHQNYWTSFDMGRSRVSLCNANFVMPTARPGDYTVELLELLSYTEGLDPEKEPDATQLEGALSAVLARRHSAGGSTLGQCNLALCLYRRLQTMNANFTTSMIDALLGLIRKAIQSVQVTLDTRAPWHHMANIPFQVVCVLLAIDSTSSLSQLKETMQCLSNVTRVYNTDATQEALRTASILVLLHKRWKERSASNLGEILELFPPVAPETTALETNLQTTLQQPALQLDWVHSLEENLSSFQDLDIDQLFLAGDILAYQ